MGKKTLNFLLLAALGAAAYYFREPLIKQWEILKLKFRNVKEKSTVTPQT